MNTRLSYLMLAAGLPVGALVGWQLGGAVGAGAMLGVLAATGVSALGVAWNARAAARGGRNVFAGFVLTFLAKLALLSLGALCLRFVDVVGERFDWSAYLLGFAATVLWAMLSSALGQLRLQRNPSGSISRSSISRSTAP